MSSYLYQALYMQIVNGNMKISQLSTAQLEGVREIAKDKLTTEEYAEIFGE